MIVLLVCYFEYRGGRLQIEEFLMEKLRHIQAAVQPYKTLFVAGAMAVGPGGRQRR